MKNTALILIALLITGSIAFAQDLNLEYYLPENARLNPNITKPSEILGHEVGEFHVTHDKLVYYMKQLADQSDRIKIQQYGQTHEKRPLLLLTISSPDNISGIDQLKDKHKKLSSGQQLSRDEIQNTPVVIWLGYSVHGNESSGSNAALLVAYYLAASENPAIKDILDSAIILIDPSINPDGLQRFSTWVNSHKSKNLVGDIHNREFHEPWPRGRTNHYWFDLNRDWLLLQQPESRGRISVFHEWKPNVVTDHHEMGSNSTIFFQPGVPSRKHPLTPDKNVMLTQLMAKYHAQALDAYQELYFTKENFDDFYYGKGSTYPDLNGSIGILFEQASSRGHLRETDNGLLDFPSTIKNQFTVSISSLTGGFELRNEILAYQNEFYQNAMKESKKQSDVVYIFGDNNDAVRVDKLARIISSHDIDIYRPTKNINIKGNTFKKESSYVIPLDQPQFLLIQALFEKRKSFEDSLFYDISAWSMDLAFNVDFQKTSSASSLIDHTKKFNPGEILKIPELLMSQYAYILPWDQYQSPAALNHLLNKNLLVKVATDSFYLNDEMKFDRGSILIPLNGQPLSDDEIHSLLQDVMNKYGIKIYPVHTGATQIGIDLGSPKFLPVSKKKILLVVGEGINAYEAGEMWYLLDYKMDIPVTLCPLDEFKDIKIFDYDVIILPDGNYLKFDDPDKLKTWLNEGGTLIAQNDAIKWLKNKNIFLGNLKNENNMSSYTEIPYGQRDQIKGSQNMGGAIFNAVIDTSHPLCYGYSKESLPVFKNSKTWLELSGLSFNHPVVFADDPLLAGYISEENLNLLKSSAGVSVMSVGEGKIMAFSINPTFRSFWYGTEKLLLNSIFFGSLIESNL